MLMLIFWFIWFHWIKKMPVPKRTIKRPKPHYTKKRHWFIRLFIDFPRRIVLDKLTLNPDRFDTYGIHIFCGEQGSGKSIAAVHFAKMLKERNPMCHIASNIDLNFQDSTVQDVTELVGTSNGESGQIIFVDEIQNWFSSMESKNFPPEMLTEVTQQRKQAKCIVGTSQVFTRISKPIREQITLMYKPTTICGALTFVRVYRCHVDQEGAVDKLKLVKIYFFVHDDELRTAYDTYAKVNRLTQKGFVPKSERWGDT